MKQRVLFIMFLLFLSPLKNFQLFSLSSEELYRALDQLLYIVQDCENSSDKDAEFQTKSTEALRYSLLLAQEKKYDALAYIGSGLTPLGLMSELYLMNPNHLSLQKAAFLECALQGQEPDFLKNTFPQAEKDELAEEEARLKQEIIKIKNLNATFHRINKEEISSPPKIVLHSLKNFEKENQRTLNDSFLVGWAKYRALALAQQKIRELLKTHPGLAPQEISSIANEKNENRLLKFFLGIGALSGIAFLVAYRLGYRPPVWVQERLSHFPEWKKLEQLTQALIQRWKIAGLSLPLLFQFKRLNNYYMRFIAPRLHFNVGGWVRNKLTFQHVHKPIPLSKK